MIKNKIKNLDLSATLKINEISKNLENDGKEVIKFGFGQCMDHTCYDILEGLLTREQAIELVKKYDGKCSTIYIKKFCEYLEFSEDEFWDVANSFRNKNIWQKKYNGSWELKYKLV